MSLLFVDKHFLILISVIDFCVTLLFVDTPFLILINVIIQLMHSFEVNIRICQPENSDVHRGEAEVNIIFEG